MRVAELWRYPVKSLQGEQLESVVVTPNGFEGDRRYAIYDIETGFGLTARRVPELLFGSARLRDDGRAEIALPDGSLAPDDDALSAWLERPVTLPRAGAAPPRRFESPVLDFETDTERDWGPFEGAPGAFHDSAGARVSLVSTATIGDWDRRRFRSNVLLEGEGEDSLVGTQIAIGE